MAGKSTTIPELTPAQADYVLSSLVKAKKISVRDIKQAVDRMHQEIAELEARLDTLRAGSSKRGRRSRSTMSTAEARASRELQGRYMSLIRQFPKTKRAQYKKMVKEQGREAAVAAMTKDLDSK